MVEDEELDKFIEEEIKKDITQEDSIDKEDVEQKLGEMGFLWDRVQNKLLNDKVCFVCKKDVDFSANKIKVVEASGVEKGSVAFVSVCEDCEKKEIKKSEETKNE